MTRSTFVFPAPSAAEGIGRLMDLGHGAIRCNWVDTPTTADFEAIVRDWSFVGGDLAGGMRALLADLGTEKRQALLVRLSQITGRYQRALPG